MQTQWRFPKSRRGAGSLGTESHRAGCKCKVPAGQTGCSATRLEEGFSRRRPEKVQKGLQQQQQHCWELMRLRLGRKGTRRFKERERKPPQAAQPSLWLKEARERHAGPFAKELLAHAESSRAAGKPACRLAT